MNGCFEEGADQIVMRARQLDFDCGFYLQPKKLVDLVVFIVYFISDILL